MKILFIQLPLPDHSFSYINGNIDYAPAVLSCYIRKNFPSVYCETLPAVLTNFCSDEIILRYIVSTKPDIVSFTSYLWNVERNLRLALRVKASLPDTKIIFGGPEISSGTVAFSETNPFVDYFITGEGEWFYHKFLSGHEQAVTVFRDRHVLQPADELLDTPAICEPITHRMLNSNNDKSVFIEMTRGCPYRCSYCYYSRNYKKVRELSFDCLVNSIKSPMNYKEIYILSPTFDRSSDFIEKLTQLKNLKHNVKLHTEIRTDRIDKKTARLMYDAGFRSLEVGLQSMNKRALGIINRESNTEKELAGMLHLKDAGIELQIGIIPGLPGDTPENFMQTVDTLIENNLGDSIELYPLMILPGTQIREMADMERVAYQPAPPYYFQSGWGFTSGDIRNISDYVEHKTDLSRSVFFLPDFNETESFLFTKGVRFNGNQIAAWDLEKFASLTERSVIDIHLTVTIESSLYSGIEKLFISLDKIRDRLINLVLYSDIIVNEEILKGFITRYENDNLHRRMNVFNSEPEASSFRFFQVSENLSAHSSMDRIYNLITPVYMITDKSRNFTKVLHGESAVLVKTGVYDSISTYLKRVYLDNPQFVVFQSEKEMERFYNDTGEEFIRFPYSFGIIEV